MGELSSHWEREVIGRHQGRDLYRQTTYLKPIAYPRYGAYQPITNVLGASGDPNLPIGVSELVEFRLRDKLAGNSPVVHFGHGGGHVRLTPLGTNNVNGQAVGTNGWLYPEAWDNADLQLVIGGHRLYKSIFLRAGHPAAFEFRVDDHGGFDPVTGIFTGGFQLLPPALDNPATGEHLPLAWGITTQGGKYILRVDLPGGNYAGWTLDPTLTLQPDAAGGQDTAVNSAAPTFNYGAATFVGFTAGANNQRPLLKFNCSSIPAGAVCIAATFTFYHAASAGANPWTATVYQIAVGNAAWIEGAQNGGLAGAGEPCWAALAADGAGGVTTPWAGAAGLSTVITDYEAAALGSVSGNRSDAAGTAYAAALNTTRGRGWFGTPNTNYGIVVFPSSNDSGAMCLSDHATPAWRPQFVVDYVLGGPAMCGLLNRSIQHSYG